jgi:hypothetical protein
MKNLKIAVAAINNVYEGIYDLSVEERDSKTYVVDKCEELYYEGFNFEKVMQALNDAVAEDIEDAYLDCVCPGRWIVG